MGKPSGCPPVITTKVTQNVRVKKNIYKQAAVAEALAFTPWRKLVQHLILLP